MLERYILLLYKQGTQIKRIMAKFPIKAVSTGDLLREQIELKTDIGNKVASLMSAGDLVSDQIVMDLIKIHLPKLRRSV